jgi:hypothetical protein
MQDHEFDEMMRGWLIRQRGRIMVPAVIAAIIWLYWYFDLYR